jgi:hypothetical protein
MNAPVTVPQIITGLYVENVQRIRAMLLEDLSGTGVIEIAGKNDSGKSSLLAAITMTLRGMGDAPETPVRVGEKRATVKLRTGNFIITRFYRVKDDGEHTTELRIEDAEKGTRYQRPQELLDRFLSGLAFDPLAFARAPGKQRLEMLRAFVPGFDFDEDERLRLRDFEERTVAGRQVKMLEAQLAGMTVVQEVQKPEPLDLAELDRQIALAEDRKADIERRRTARATLRALTDSRISQRERLLAEAAELRKRAGDLESEAQGLKNTIDKDEERLAKAGPLPELIDAAEAERRKAGHALALERYESYLRQKKNRDDLAAAVEQARQQVKDLTDALADRAAKRQRVLAAADLPIEGLELREDDVYLNGVTVSQASSAQKIRIGTVLAMAKEPLFRVCIIADGSLLDDEAMEFLRAEAKRRGFQIWIERVDPSTDAAIILVDGHIDGQGVVTVPAWGQPAVPRRSEPEEMPPGRATPTYAPPPPAQTPAADVNPFEGEL